MSVLRAAVLLLCVAAIVARVGGQTNVTWTAFPADTPVVYEPDLNPTSTYFWNDPTVVPGADGGLVMWATTPLGFDSPVQIYRGESSDGGASWAMNVTVPALAAGGAGTYDGAAVETPSVVYFGGKYHMYYTAEQDHEDVSTWSIGHAVSATGVSGTWQRDAAPVVTRDGIDGLLAVAEPGAVVFGDRLLLFFTAVYLASDSVSANFTIAVVAAAADNGSVFSWPPQTALALNETIYPRTDGWLGYSTPNAAVLRGQLHLYTDVYRNGSIANCSAQDQSQAAIHHFVSAAADGQSQFQADAAPIFRREDFVWTYCEIRSGYTIAADGDGSGDDRRIYMWFAGQSITTSDPWWFGIGYANATLPQASSGGGGGGTGGGNGGDGGDNAAAGTATWMLLLVIAGLVVVVL